MKRILLILILFIGLFTLSGCPPEQKKYSSISEQLEVDRFEYYNEDFDYTDESLIISTESNSFECYDTYEEFHEVFNDQMFSKYNEKYFENKSLLVLNILEKRFYFYYETSSYFKYDDERYNKVIKIKLEIERSLMSKEEVNKNVVLIITMNQKSPEILMDKFQVDISTYEFFIGNYIVYDFKSHEINSESFKHRVSYLITDYKELKKFTNDENILNKYNTNNFDYSKYSLLAVPLIEDGEYEYQNVVITNGLITIERKRVTDEVSLENKKVILMIQTEKIHSSYLYTKCEFPIDIKET